MMINLRTSFSFSCWLLLCLSVTETHGWNTPPTKPTSSSSRNKIARDVVATAWIGGMALFAPLRQLPNNDVHAGSSFWQPPIAVAAVVDALSSSSPSSGIMDEEQLKQSLKPATSEQPQIMLPTGSSVPAEKQPIVEGLISLANPTSELRPMSTDTMVVTFTTFSKPDVVLGGARIPVSRAARFPLAFRMFPKNLVKTSSSGGDNQKQQKQTPLDWNSMDASQEDLLVQVLVCPENNPKCTESESRMKSQAVAKLIRNLPGQLQDQTIRAPAALRLQ